MTKIGVILGSTRPGRKGEVIAKWAVEAASKRTDATFELIDLADFPLPHLDEEVPPSRGLYANDHTKAWSDRIAGFDGFVFVTPEYNHSTSGVLKNALDYLYLEWNNKAVGFVSYGVAGGIRAVEHLRVIVAELQMADVRNQVAISLINDFTNFTTFNPSEVHEASLSALLNQLVSWSDALAPLRTPATDRALS
jgi:NAD(P)H-dependent FMN reductase